MRVPLSKTALYSPPAKGDEARTKRPEACGEGEERAAACALVARHLGERRGRPRGEGALRDDFEGKVSLHLARLALYAVPCELEYPTLQPEARGAEGGRLLPPHLTHPEDDCTKPRVEGDGARAICVPQRDERRRTRGRRRACLRRLRRR